MDKKRKVSFGEGIVTIDGVVVDISGLELSTNGAVGTITFPDHTFQLSEWDDGPVTVCSCGNAQDNSVSAHDLARKAGDAFFNSAMKQRSSARTP